MTNTVDNASNKFENKIYYSVYTSNEKIWIRADLSEIVDGCLTFYDVDEVTNAKVLIAAFPADYWKYMYEADMETGESINEQIPFWKRHNAKFEGDISHEPRHDSRPYNRDVQPKFDHNSRDYVPPKGYKRDYIQK